jgi:hypothetical protein
MLSPVKESNRTSDERDSTRDARLQPLCAPEFGARDRTGKRETKPGDGTTTTDNGHPARSAGLQGDDAAFMKLRIPTDPHPRGRMASRCSFGSRRTPKAPAAFPPVSRHNARGRAKLLGATDALPPARESGYGSTSAARRTPSTLAQRVVQTRADGLRDPGR